MSNKKLCLDFYGEKITIGDEVIPMLGNEMRIGVGGFISDIKYDEQYDEYCITITDNEGNVLLKNADARSYTTKERFKEREVQDFVYMITFYNANLKPLTTIPLTNITDENYEIPDETCFAILRACHADQKLHSYISNIYHFIVDDNFELCYEKQEGILYLFTLNRQNKFPINVNYKNFKTYEELKQYTKGIIKYFKECDLTHINNNEFDKNEIGKEFEKRLIHYLKQ